MTVRKGYVDVDEGQIHYRHAGERDEDPPLVLLHQNTCSSDVYAEVMAELAPWRAVLAPDTPGAGLSYTPADVPSMTYYARVLLRALDALDVGAAHVCGHHTGASIAVEMATVTPDRIRSVSVCGPPYLTERERERFRDQYDPADAVAPLDDEGDYLLHHWHNHAAMGGEGSLDHRHRQVVDALLAREGIRQVYGTIWDQDFPALFDAIEAPRLLLCAPDDDLWDAFVQARDANPEVPAVELSGGNYEPLRDAERFAAALRSFIED